MVALVNAPPEFGNTLRHQLIRQILTSDMWVLLKEPPKKVERPEQRPPANLTGKEVAVVDDEMAYSLLELELQHATRPTVPTFTSEARGEEAVQAASYGSIEGVAVPGLQLMQDFKKAGVPTDLVVNPFSRYGKRITWEELEWLAANGRRLLKIAAAKREDPSSLSPAAIISGGQPPLPDLIEGPVRHPFNAFVRPNNK